MANDKLMTYDQGESIKTKLTDIANNISNINKNIELPSSKITTMQNYTKGSSTASISPSDSLNQAVAKLENRTDVNQNNISNIQTKLTNLYIQSSEPTGTIPDGAVWINTSTPTPLSDYIKKYHVSLNILDPSIIENNYTLDTSTGLPAVYSGRAATVTPIDVENYNSLRITYNVAVSLMYSTFNANNELIIREINKSSGFTFDVSNAKYLYLCWYTSGNITKDDIGNIMLNEGTTAKPYEPYSAEIWHSNT